MLNVKYFGRSAVMVSSEKKSIILDPGVYENTVLVPDITKVDIICVSNASEDAFGNTIALSKSQKASVLGNEEVIEKAKDRGIQPWRIRHLEEGKSFDLEDVQIMRFNLTHGPANDPTAPLNSGFIVKLDEIVVGHMGSAIGVGAFARQDIQVLLIPVGGNTTFDGKTALQALGQIKPKLAIPIHASKPEDSEYFLQHHKYFAPDTKVVILQPNEEISVEYDVGQEFSIRKR
ncbi:MAG: MBL fold metallo-hydrolase [Candidatus Ranarchaeia archaeon]|jgi:L-ascorbate metabolism protein UlaG (beta-lactamase superfamily)